MSIVKSVMDMILTRFRKFSPCCIDWDRHPSGAAAGSRRCSATPHTLSVASFRELRRVPHSNSRQTGFPKRITRPNTRVFSLMCRARDSKITIPIRVRECRSMRNCGTLRPVRCHQMSASPDPFAAKMRQSSWRRIRAAQARQPMCLPWFEEFSAPSLEDVGPPARVNAHHFDHRLQVERLAWRLEAVQHVGPGRRSEFGRGRRHSEAAPRQSNIGLPHQVRSINLPNQTFVSTTCP